MVENGAPIESTEQRARRRARRLLFDTIAEAYAAVRPTYPAALLDRIAVVSQLAAGASVLEIGCGAGQFTTALAARSFAVTAIDPSPTMIDLAKGTVGSDSATFVVSTFEDFDGEVASFDLIASASAFHWVDPEVRWSKTHQLLRPRGWLALVDTSLRHEPYLQDALLQLWIEHSDDGGAFASNPPPTMQEQIRTSGLYSEPIVEEHTSEATMTAEEVIALAQTSGAFLSYSNDRKRSFVDKLQAVIKSPEVHVQRGATLVMAQAA